MSTLSIDSIPFDLGMVSLQIEMQQRLGVFLQQVIARVTVIKRTLSEGTEASALATFEQIGRELGLDWLMGDPFALIPDFQGPVQVQPDGEAAGHDDWIQALRGPFVTAAINAKPCTALAPCAAAHGAHARDLAPLGTSATGPRSKPPRAGVRPAIPTRGIDSRLNVADNFSPCVVFRGAE